MVRTYIDDQLTQRTLDIQRDGSIDRTELSSTTAPDASPM